MQQQTAAQPADPPAGTADVIAQEQVKLLETFQNIRQWQQHQQAALMRQQQAQMSKLLAEQDRITNLIGQQRDGHWQNTPGMCLHKSENMKSLANTGTKRSKIFVIWNMTHFTWRILVTAGSKKKKIEITNYQGVYKFYIVFVWLQPNSSRHLIL